MGGLTLKIRETIGAQASATASAIGSTPSSSNRSAESSCRSGFAAISTCSTTLGEGCQREKDVRRRRSASGRDLGRAIRNDPPAAGAVAGVVELGEGAPGDRPSVGDPALRTRERERVRYSELFPALRARGLTVERTIEVLTGLDLLNDDRMPAFERWLDRKLADLAVGIRTEVEAWLRHLRDGGPRARPRAQDTIWAYLNEIQLVLAEWSTRYDHLRQVTRADVVAVADGLQGSKRHHTLSVLRSLFRHAKHTGAVFRDPTARIRVGRQPYGLILPLEPVDLREAVTAAATPAARLARPRCTPPAPRSSASCASTMVGSSPARAARRVAAWRSRRVTSSASSIWKEVVVGQVLGVGQRETLGQGVEQPAELEPAHQVFELSRGLHPLRRGGPGGGRPDGSGAQGGGLAAAPGHEGRRVLNSPGSRANRPAAGTTCAPMSAPSVEAVAGAVWAGRAGAMVRARRVRGRGRGCVR